MSTVFNGVLVQAQYDVGDQPSIISTFKDSAGDLADPSTVIFSVREPDGTITTEALGDATKLSLGVWTWLIPFPFDAEGVWWARANATAPFNSAEEIALGVGKSMFS